MLALALPCALWWWEAGEVARHAPAKVARYAPNALLLLRAICDDLGLGFPQTPQEFAQACEWRGDSLNLYCRQIPAFCEKAGPPPPPRPLLQYQTPAAVTPTAAAAALVG